MDLAETTIIRCEACSGLDHAIAIAVGYPGAAPDLGGIDAERAQEIVVAMQCSTCAHSQLGWQLRLREPYALRGDEEWLRAIQGRFR